MTKALCPLYDHVTLAMCDYLMPEGFDVDHGATVLTSTYEALKAHWDKTGRIIVNRDHSDNTVYAKPSTNWAFRAWHDHCHIAGGFPFTREGEIEACHMQQSQVSRHFGKAYGRETIGTLQAILWAKVVDQAICYEETGEFTTSQREFVASKLQERGYKLECAA